MARKHSQPEVSRRKFLAGAAVAGAAASTSVAKAATPGATAADVKPCSLDLESRFDFDRDISRKRTHSHRAAAADSSFRTEDFGE